MANTMNDAQAMVVLSCDHTVRASKTVYLSGSGVPPMEWCGKCGHARFVKGWC